MTVFFRLLLALPHIIWLVLWAIAALVVAIVAWFGALANERPPRFCHAFLSSFVRYSVHVSAYLSLTANRFPGFAGEQGSYEIDVVLPDEPQLQNRWKTGFRLILAIPAFFVEGALTGGSAGRSGGYNANLGALWASAFLGWWAALFTGRMPEGLRDLNLYALRYSAQTSAYFLLVTESYPDADAFAPPVPASAPPHPVTLTASDELERNRLTVFFRLLLVIPHWIWVALWSIAVLVVAIVGWFAALFTGRLPDSLHSFMAAFARYYLHVQSYFYLAGGPFPGFLGKEGTYPLELRIAPPELQNRWKTGFRWILAVPALILAAALGGLLGAAAFLSWFAVLFTGRMPRGLLLAEHYALRYGGQLSAYALLLTDRYPYASPARPAEAHGPEPVLAAETL
ncbi:MAG TPA: DUF4389 domain-containing protein [Thermoleophilaceae bacterium]|nr:DUF4389 domain-containing protein [Thermoleophilaceae bacterium]